MSVINMSFFQVIFETGYWFLKHINRLFINYWRRGLHNVNNLPKTYNNNKVHHSFYERRLSMSPFHFCLSAVKNLSSFQLLPASLITDLLQLFLGLPLFLFPWGFQSRAAFGISSSSFLNVWPIHLKFLFLISKFISSCPVTIHRSLLEIIFGYHILNIYLRHLFTKVCILRWISFCDKPSLTSIQKYGFHTGIKNPNLSVFL